MSVARIIEGHGAVMRFVLAGIALVMSLAACPPREASLPPKTGAFLVRFTSNGIAVSRGTDGRPLLSSLAGGEGAYAPVAIRKATASWEMQYGSFRVTDGREPWKSGSRMVSLGERRVAFAAEGGELVATLETAEPSEGVLSLSFRAADPSANRISAAFACAGDDRFLGFGAQADALDHRGHKVPIWTSEPGVGKSSSDEPSELWMLEGTRHGSSMGLPTFLSQRGYIAAVRSDRRTEFELCSSRKDAWRVSTFGPELTILLYDGPSPAKALERATAGILGRPMRPPPIAFAPWNDAIFGSDSVRKVAKLLRERKIPSSAIWTEDFRGGVDVPGQGYRLVEEWDTDRTLYPDTGKLSAELHAQGFAWLAYFNTFLVQKTRIFAEALAGGHLVKSPTGEPYLFSGATFQPTGLADLSRKETRQWVRKYLHLALDQGFDGWMADFGEWLPHDAVLASGEDPQEAHNRYADEWIRVNAEAFDERKDPRQRLFFARAGWLGSTSRAPVFWAGDQRTSFQADDGLPTVIPMGLNLGLAGVSTYGHDIGGYQSVSNAPSTKELFFRWTTLGALSPVMRTHHGLDARANWWFGKDEDSIAHFRRWASFHIRLFPYLDAGSAEAESTGMPLMRALPLVFPEDSAGWTLADEYLLGPSLLVAPVIEEGKVARKVHFPVGKWIPLEAGEAVQGPIDVEVSAPLTEIPVFARAGSIVPLLPESVQTLLPADPPLVDLDDVKDRRVLLVFPHASGRFTERNGTSYSLEASGTRAGYFEDGKELPPCASAAQRGCVDASNGVRVRLAGSGPLEFPGTRLAIEGALREIDVVVR